MTFLSLTALTCLLASEPPTIVVEESTPVGVIGSSTLLSADSHGGACDGLPAKPVPEQETDAVRRLLNPLLFGDRFTDRTGFFVDGFMRQSYVYNGYRPASGYNGTVTLLDRANDYRLNQLYLRFGRNLDTNGDRFDLGGQVDLLYGTDAFFTQALGLDQRIVSGATDYRMAVPQLYAEAFAPLGAGLRVKAGHFYSIVGYDVVPAANNFFTTRQYAFTYGEPFTHTGILADQKLTSNLSLQAGVVRGWDNWVDNNNALSFLGGVSWAGCENKSKIAFAVIAGPEQDEPRRAFQGVVGAPGESLNRVAYSLVVQQALGEKWRAVFQHDAGFQDGSAVAGLTPRAEWYGVNQHLFYEYNECLQLGVRAEWFRDDDGARAVPPRASRVLGNLASASNYYAVSLGANIKANEWAILRPEVRWDFQDRDDPFSPRQFDDGRRSNQLLAVVDLVLRF
jgi:hypothetical protein